MLQSRRCDSLKLFCSQKKWAVLNSDANAVPLAATLLSKLQKFDEGFF